MNSTKEFLLTELNSTIDFIDYSLIGSVSFDDRSRTIASKLDNDKILNTIFFHNQIVSHSISGKRKLAHIEALKEILGSKLELLVISKDDPIKLSESLFKGIKNIWSTTSNNIVVDITTFTREALLILVKIFATLYDGKKKIIFLYNPAQEYSYNEKESDKKWLSKGIRDTRTVLGFPGRFKPTNKLHLIIIVGYEYEKAKKLIDIYEPSLLTLAIPSAEESINKDVYNICALKYEDLLKIYDSSAILKLPVSGKDPIKTKEILQIHIKKNEGYNHVIAPLNNKISTLGCALVALKNNTIQLCYTRASIYNVNGYSLASDYCYLFNFEDLIN